MCVFNSFLFNFFGLQGIIIFSFCHDLFTLFKEKLQHCDYTWKHTKLQSPIPHPDLRGAESKDWFVYWSMAGVEQCELRSCDDTEMQGLTAASSSPLSAAPWSAEPCT